jgi:hypothetical protein
MVRTCYLLFTSEQAEMNDSRPEGWASIGPGVEVTPNIAWCNTLEDGSVLVCALFNPPLTGEVETAIHSWPEWVGETPTEVVAALPELDGFVTVVTEEGPIEVPRFSPHQWI